MSRRWRMCILIAALAGAGGCLKTSGRREPAVVAEARAVGFLEREVPAWSKDNGCFSCHNNGDGARALYAAVKRGYRLPADALADTTDWIAHPERWEHNKGDPGFSDKRLANIQFASALIAAFEAGQVKDAHAVQVAAQKVAADQSGDGTWPIEPNNAVGSPATYGTTLATHMALQTLKRAGAPGTAGLIGKAERWLRRAQPNNVPAAAALLLAARPEDLQKCSQECLPLIRRAQTHDGGWGPYADTPPEAFDTALVLLALAQLRDTPELGRGFLPREDLEELIRGGRRFLAAEQDADGSWRATTRPAGGSSYAQRISTTGWATLALLATRGQP